jgi:hypothetical protein
MMKDSDSEERHIDSPFFHLEDVMAIPFLKHCEQCHRPAKNLCSNCKAVYYCGRECQTKHWKFHKPGCTAVKQELAKLKKEEEKLDKSLCEPSHRYFGMFWACTQARPFLQSLGNVAMKYGTIESKQSAREGVLYAMKLLYFSRRDTMEYVDVVSNFLLRIDQDQLAFDFIRWFARDPIHGMGKLNIPYLSDWQCDRSEDLCAAGYFMSPANIADYALIKLRMYFYLHDLDALYTFLMAINKQEGNTSFPVASKLASCDRVLHLVKDYVLGPSELKLGKFSCRDKQEMLTQIYNTLKNGEKESNPRIWKAIINPQPLLEQCPPQMRLPGTAEACYRAIDIVQYTWYSIRNQRALAFLRQYVMDNGGPRYDARFGVGGW